jgi:DNA-binding MltR family transcriptional regulator
MANNSKKDNGDKMYGCYDLQDNLLIFHNQFNYDDNDRAIVIVGLAFIEDLLLNILENFFPDNSKTVVKLLNYSGALGTINSKISLLYGLGFIDKIVMQDLNIVAQIRNNFAHKTNISFDDKSIINLCKKLKWHEISMMVNTPESATAQEIFKVNINTLVSHLSAISSIAQGEKRKIKESL